MRYHKHSPRQTNRPAPPGAGWLAGNHRKSSIGSGRSRRFKWRLWSHANAPQPLVILAGRACGALSPPVAPFCTLSAGLYALPLVTSSGGRSCGGRAALFFASGAARPRATGGAGGPPRRGAARGGCLPFASAAAGQSLAPRSLGFGAAERHLSARSRESALPVGRRIAAANQ